MRLTFYDVERNAAHEVTLRFIEIYGHPHVLYPGTHPPQWAAALLDSSLVRWTVGDNQAIGTPVVVTDRKILESEILPRFVARFGRARISKWFGDDIGCFRLIAAEDGVPYYRAVEALFDQSAPRYDGVVENNGFDLHLRNVAIADLLTLFRAGDRVLELGCGTGLETIPLAKSGVHIVAVDISSGMLGRLRRKARAGSVEDLVETRLARLSQLPEMVSDLGPSSFDGVFSHFGALNCEPQLAVIPRSCHSLLRPGGILSLGVWNRTCLLEMIGYSVRGRPRRALARLQSSVPVGESGFGVPVFPYSPREIVRLFSPYFVLQAAAGVSVVMPPYNLAGRFGGNQRLVDFLEAADGALRRRRFLRYLGDYFLLTLRRT